MMNNSLIFIVFYMLTSCKPSPISQVPPSGIAGSSQKQTQAATQTIMEQTIISGRVMETIPAEGMCFIKIQKQASEDLWVSVLQQCPPLQNKITIKSELSKTNFLSQQINKRFNRLYFGELTN